MTAQVSYFLENFDSSEKNNKKIMETNKVYGLVTPQDVVVFSASIKSSNARTPFE